MAHTVARNAAFLTMSLVGQKILSFVYFALIARTLGVEETGIYVFVVSFVSLFGVIADAGITPVVIRSIAEVREHSQYSPDTIKILVGALRIKMVLIVVAVISTIGFAYIFQYPEHVILAIMVTCAVMVCDACHVFAYGILRGMQTLMYEAVGMLCGQMLVVILGGFALYVGYGIYALIGALLAGSMVNVLISIVSVRRARLPILWRQTITQRDIYMLLKTALPFALAGILARGYSQIDIIILSKLGGLRDVGIYSVPSKLVFAFQFIPLAISASIYPAMSHALTISRETLSKITHASMLYLMGIAVPIIMILLLLGDLVIRYVFGPTYYESSVLLMILAPALLFGFLDFPIGSLLNASHKQKDQTLSMVYTLVTNVGLNILLIPRYGVLGATIAALLSQIVLLSTGLYFARFEIAWRFDWLLNRFFRFLLSSFVVSFIAYLCLPRISTILLNLKNAHESFGVLATLLATMSGMGVLYIIVVLLFRAILVSELKQFCTYLKR